MTTDPHLRVQRSDAQRSRSRLLEAAAAEFARTDAPTFKDIAGTAGVGIATLFRHFPTRDVLVEAVFEQELARLCDASDLLASLSPDEALRRWLVRWSEFAAAKRGMADDLQSLLTAGVLSRSDTAARLTTSVQLILDAGSRTGKLRDDVRADDVIAVLAGILTVAGSAERQDQAHRLLDLLMDGLRARTRG